MEFTELEIQDMAAFFARRFPSAAERHALTAGAGLPAGPDDADPVRAWEATLRAAVASRAVPRLVAAALVRRPDDENLQEMARVVPGERRAGRRLAWGAAAVTVLAVVALVVVLYPRPPRSTPPPAAPAVEAPPPAASAVVAPPPAAPIAEAPPPAAPIAEAPPPAPAPAPRPRGGPTACPGLAPGVTGWWHAGRTSPGAAGSEYTIPSGINVRDAVPSEATGWALGGFLCSLRQGARVRIASEPVFVRGGAWWVPVRAEDLLEP